MLACYSAFVTDKMPDPSSKHSTRLKVIGVIVLALGIISAGLVYFIGTRSADLSDDPSMAGYDKPEERQMEILYGKSGELAEDLSNDLKQPDTQAAIIVVASALLAGGFFYFARLMDD